MYQVAKETDTAVLIQGRNSTDGIDFQAALDELALEQHFEFLVAVDVNRTVKFSAFQSDLVGQVFDPEGTVSRVFADPINHRRVVANGMISLKDLKSSRSPVHRSVLADYYSESHPLETNRDGYIRWAAVANFDEQGTLAGAIVSGYVLSGKAHLCKRFVELLGTKGFASLVYKQRGRWDHAQSIRLAQSFFVRPIVFFNNPEFFEETVSSRRSVFRKRYFTEGARIQGDSWQVAGVPLPRSGVVRNSIIVPDYGNETLLAVMGEDRAQVLSIFRSIWLVDVALLFLCVTVGLIWTVLLINWFINPLESLLQYVNAKMFDKFQQALDKIPTARVIWSRALLGTLVSSSFIFAVLGYNLSRFAGAYPALASINAEGRVGDLGFKMKLQSLDAAMKAIAREPHMLEVLQGFSNDQELIEANDDFEKLRDFYQCEISLLVNLNKTVLISAVPGIPAGSEFDHDGIVGEAIRKQRGIEAPVIVPENVFTDWNPKRFRDSFFDSEDLNTTVFFPTGKLILRLKVFPMVIEQEEPLKDEIIGFTVMGDLINGKTKIASLPIQEYGSGYDAIYFYDEDSKSFQLLTSTFRESSATNPLYGVALSDHQSLFESLRKRTSVVSRNVKIKGVSMDIRVSRAPPPREQVFDGEAFPLLARIIPLFIVRGQVNQEWNSSVRSQLGVQTTLTVFYFVASICISIIVLRPVLEFTKNLVLHQKKMERKQFEMQLKAEEKAVETRPVRVSAFRFAGFGPAGDGTIEEEKAEILMEAETPTNQFQN